MRTIELKCSGCGITFNKPTNEYNRQLRKGRIFFYCNLNCSSKYTSDGRIKCKEIVSNCLFCKKLFLTTTHKKARKCCSLDCAKKQSQSFVNYTNISKTLKLYYKNNPIKKHITVENRKCKMCNVIFNIETWNPKKTCSDKCFRELLRKNSTFNPNCGGSTNYKKIKYKDIWMDSSWEVEVAKLMDDKNIIWERSRKNHMFWWTDETGTKRRYYPDFYLPKYNLYLDPKNKYKITLDEYKMNQVIKENNINLVWGLLPYIKETINNLIPQ